MHQFTASPHAASTVVPLPELIASYAEALAAADELQIRTVETYYAHYWWAVDMQDATAQLENSRLGNFYHLRRNVAQAFGFSTQAHDCAMSWMVWASDNEDVGQYWLARARLAEDEARRFLDFISSGGMEAAVDSDIPLISRLVRELQSYSDLLLHDGDTSPKRFALIEALIRVEAAAMAARRPDLAAKLQQLIRQTLQTVNQTSCSWFALSVTLMDARDLHFHGEVVEAARLCASALNSESDATVIGGFRLRSNLAEYSVETQYTDTALRMLQNNLAVAASYGLDLDHALAARELCRIMAHTDTTDELIAIAQGALQHCGGFPDCALTMELKLALAEELLETGQSDRALVLAQEVANWSSTTRNFARTSHACETAALAALDTGDIEHSAQLYLDLAQIRSSYAAPQTPAETLLAAANLHAQVEDDSTEAVDALMSHAAETASDQWETAKWNETMAMIQWGRWDDQAACRYSEEAYRRFLDVGAPVDAARALTVAASAALSAKDDAAAREYEAQISALVPEHHPVRESLREIMSKASPDPSA